MAENFYKLSNPEFIIWMKNMLLKVEGNNAVANIDADLLANSKVVRNNLATNLEERQNLSDSLAGKNEEIKFNRKDANKMAALIRDALKINQNVSNSFVEEAGFNVDDNIKSFTPPTAPQDLVASGTSDGTNHLKWNRNGNKQGTLFMIEAKIGNSGEWVLIDTVTSTKYDHKNQTPGVKVQYRIRAKRGDAVSSASNTATVYD